jgi:hypothetical protein
MNEPTIWDELLSRADNEKAIVYRRLDMDTPFSMRRAILYPSLTRAFIIELGIGSEFPKRQNPSWKGMNIDEVFLDIPVRGTRHIMLELLHDELKDIFEIFIDNVIDVVTVSKDLGQMNEGLQRLIFKWDFFFKNSGPDGLSEEMQRGLMGELIFLKTLIQRWSGWKAVESWRGWERGRFDYILDKSAIEIKTSMSMEPIKVRISNEGQLDDRGLNALYLGIYNLEPSVNGEISLRNLVDDIENILTCDWKASLAFKERLTMYGYLPIHDNKYFTKYRLKTENFYSVIDGFPRITSIPQGIADVQYSLIQSACEDFRIDQETMLVKIGVI